MGVISRMDENLYHRAGLNRDNCPDGPEADMRTIITHWTATTGRDVKTRKVAAN